MYCIYILVFIQYAQVDLRWRVSLVPCLATVVGSPRRDLRSQNRGLGHVSVKAPFMKDT